MKKSGLIAIYSLLSAFVLGVIATVIILASSTQNIGSKVSVVYVATEISGSVSATYKVGSSEAKDMTDSNGNTVVSFASDQPTTTSLLAPKETINLSSTDDVIFTYTFTNIGEQYYASVSYEDTDTTSPSKNLSIMYQNSTASSGYSEEDEVVTVPTEGSVTYSIKISIKKIYLNASLNGTISWVLTKEKPKTVSEYITLSSGDNTGSSISNDTFSYITRNGTQFKIVGAVPDASTTTTSGYVNGGYSTRAPIDSSNNGLLSVTDLTNSNGAEFYYFCTNPAVVGNSSYVDPGTIYWTSTADGALETWYDIPSKRTKLYSCFMTPNFTGAEVDSNNCYNGSATQIVISNSVKDILYRAFYNKSTITDVVIPQSVKNIGYGTSNTSYGAFRSCSKLTKISLPNSVTSIGNYAFYYCSGLTGTLTIPSSVTSIGEYAFASCKGLTGTLTIPSSVTSIGNYAFYYCSGLTGALTIPDSVTSIGNSAFYYCSGLTSLTMGSGVTSIGNHAFYECYSLTSITIPDSVTSIGNSAFNNCDNLTYNTYDNVKYLGNETNPYLVAVKAASTSITSCTLLTQTKFIYCSAFYNCSGLTSITIPNRVTSIGYDAFYNCSGLTGTLTIPSSVTSIGADAFYNCSGLTGTLTIPSSVTSIGSSAFAGCTRLTSITVESENTKYYSSDNCLIETSTKTLIAGCNNSTIPSDVKCIGSYAFYNCSGLTGTLTIPSSVTSIGVYAFYNCKGLTGTLTIPSGVTGIGSHTFYNCSGLTGTLTIPSGVTYIGGGAFENCSGLTGSLTIPNSVRGISSDAFAGCTGLTSIRIGNGVSAIEAGTFYDCTGLTSVTIGYQVASIKGAAFSGCSNLTEVIFENTTKTWKIAIKRTGIWWVTGESVAVASYSPTDTSTNATNLTSTYVNYTWTRNS